VTTDTHLAGLGLGCSACGQVHDLGELAWRCRRCGWVLDLVGFRGRVPDRGALAGRAPSLWRYAEALPLAEPARISLGEGLTPLVAAPGRPGVALKLDHVMPTGSFKDRGAVLLVGLADRLGVSRLVADSSGNAGAAVATYAARAGLACVVFVPAATSSR
jgi:threonine synthase